MCRVFLFEETHLDISKLKDFGQVTYVFHTAEGRRPLRDEKLEDQIISQLTRFRFDPDKDYVAIVGQVLTVAIFVSAVVSTYRTVNALCFDANESSYYERGLGELMRTTG